MRKIVAVFAGMAFMAAAWCADVNAGKDAYDKECGDCHDLKGAAVASVAKSMKKQGVTMRDLASKEVQAQTDDQWKKMILEGTGKMKPIKTMSAADIDNCIAFMRTLKKKK